MICQSLTHFLADLLVCFLFAFGAALAMALVLGALLFLTFGLAAAFALGLAGDFAFAGDFAGLAGDLALGALALGAGLAGEATGAATTGAGAATTTGAALTALALVALADFALATTLATFAFGAVLDYVMMEYTCDRAVLLAMELTIYANCANLLFIIPELKACILIGYICDSAILPLFLWIFPSLSFQPSCYHSNIIILCVDHLPASFILPFLLRDQRG